MHAQIDGEKTGGVKCLAVIKIRCGNVLQLIKQKADPFNIRRVAGSNVIPQNHGLNRKSFIDELIDDVQVQFGDDAPAFWLNPDETV